MRYKKKFKKIGDYGILTHKHTYQLRQQKKLYSARTEKELLEYLKEKGIL